MSSTCTINNHWRRHRTQVFNTMRSRRAKRSRTRTDGGIRDRQDRRGLWAGSNSLGFLGNFSALCFPAAVTVRFWQSCSGGSLTSLPVLGADGVHLGLGLRAHPSLRRAVLNIQHGPSSPLHSSLKQLFISQTTDLDIILQKRDEHLCSFTICCTSAEFSARARNAVRRLLHHFWHRCCPWHVFSSTSCWLLYKERCLFVLIIFLVFAFISYEIFPWFLSFKVSFNEVK